MKLTRLSAALVLAFGIAAGAPAHAQTSKSDSTSARSTLAEPVKREDDWSWLGLLGLLGLVGLFRRREHEPRVHATHTTRTANDRVRVYTK